MKSLLIYIILFVFATIILFGQEDTISAKNDSYRTVKKLIVWYRDFNGHSKNYQLMKQQKYDGKLIWRVNTISCRKYLDRFKKSKLFTSTYLKRTWNDLEKMDSILLATKETDLMNVDSPAMLTSDPIFFANDYIDYLNKFDKLKYGVFQMKSSNIYSIEVIIEDYRYLYTLRKVNKRLQIENIEPIL